MRSSRVILMVLFALILSTSIFANGLSLNSIGPRAASMGGAFVGLADDVTAIYWNPAGLAGQGNAVSIFVADIIPMASYKTPDGTPSAYAIDAEAKTNHYVSPNFMGVYSFGKLTVGFGAYVPAGLGTEWDGADFGTTSEMMSKIGVFNFSPVVAYQINDQFSVGLAANIYYGMFEMKRPNDTGDAYSEESSGLGYGASLGIKYQATDKISFGLTYRLPVNVTLEGTADNGGLDMDLKRDVEWPTWIAGGLAFKISDQWTVTADVQYSNWGSFEYMITEYDFTHPVAGPMSTKDSTEMKWESQFQFRLGTEYLLNENLALRGGYYYDPAPAPDETVNNLFPSSTNHVITLGAGYQVSNFSFDFCAEYLFGAERDIEATAENEMPGKHQMDVFAITAGVNYYFNK